MILRAGGILRSKASERVGVKEPEEQALELALELRGEAAGTGRVAKKKSSHAAVGIWNRLCNRTTLPKGVHAAKAAWEKQQSQHDNKQRGSPEAPLGGLAQGLVDVHCPVLVAHEERGSGQPECHLKEANSD